MIIAISLGLSLLGKIFNIGPTAAPMGGILFAEGIFIMFFSIFGYCMMQYSYGKRGSDAFSPKTMEQAKRIVPRIVLTFGLIAAIGFFLMLMKI